jgi:hypothetical protein
MPNGRIMLHELSCKMALHLGSLGPLARNPYS